MRLRRGDLCRPVDRAAGRSRSIHPRGPDSGLPWARGTALAPGLADPEQLVPALAQEHLGTVTFVMFSGALVSVILSTVDSTLLAAGGMVSHNLVTPSCPV